MENPHDRERFEEIIAALKELPAGLDDALRNDLLREPDNLEYTAGLGLLAVPDDP